MYLALAYAVGALMLDMVLLMLYSGSRAMDGLWKSLVTLALFWCSGAMQWLAAGLLSYPSCWLIAVMCSSWSTCTMRWLKICSDSKFVAQRFWLKYFVTLVLFMKLFFLIIVVCVALMDGASWLALYVIFMLLMVLVYRAVLMEQWFLVWPFFPRSCSLRSSCILAVAPSSVLSHPLLR